MTLLELTIVMTIMVMVVGALGSLTRTVQQGFEYSEGYGIATQHARVILDRISQNVCRATGNAKFPGCIVVAETIGAYRYPDTLVIWRPSASAPDTTSRLPLYNELIIYSPSPTLPNQFLEITPASNDVREVPVVTDQSGWQSELAALKQASTTNTVVLSTLLRTCSTSSSGGGTLRGAARFETRLRPSETNWSDYTAVGSTVKWMDLPWVQGIYGPQAGLRQVWVRMELQFVPGVDWIESNAAAAQAVPFCGSAALYYSLPHPIP